MTAGLTHRPTASRNSRRRRPRAAAEPELRPAEPTDGPPRQTAQARASSGRMSDAYSASHGTAALGRRRANDQRPPATEYQRMPLEHPAPGRDGGRGTSSRARDNDVVSSLPPRGPSGAERPRDESRPTRAGPTATSPQVASADSPVSRIRSARRSHPHAKPQAARTVVVMDLTFSHGREPLPSQKARPSGVERRRVVRSGTARNHRDAAQRIRIQLRRTKNDGRRDRRSIVSQAVACRILRPNQPRKRRQGSRPARRQSASFLPGVPPARSGTARRIARPQARGTAPSDR